MSEFEDLEPAEVDVHPTLAAQLAGRCGAAPDAIKDAMGSAFGELMAFIGQHGLAPSGPPRTIYSSYGPEGVAFTAAMPVAAPSAALPEGGRVTISTLPGVKTLRFTHRGPYTNLMATYNRITQYLTAKGLLKSECDWARFMPMWEEYLNDPCQTPETDLLTHICLPLP
jgi:effector-binding domain-containing protein